MMAKPLVSDGLWERIEPLLPAPKPRRARYPGRKPLGLRRVLTGIVFVLKSGIPWEELPVEMGCGCGMSCLNYLRSWQQSGLWERIHEVLLAHFPGADKIDWSRVAREATDTIPIWGRGATMARSPVSDWPALRRID
jgi:transposase